MKETLRHSQAFDFFFSLGDKRSLAKVSRQFNVSVQSLVKWSKNFNWEFRIEQRNIESSRKMEQKTNRDVLNTRADYRKEIKESLSILKAALNTVIKELPNGKKGLAVRIEDITDLTKILKAYKDLTTLDLELMGEGGGDKDKIDIHVTLSDENEDAV